MTQFEEPVTSSRPPLPPKEDLERLGESELGQLEEGMAAEERRLRQLIAPIQAQLTELARERALLATERRRRERQQHLQRRREVREQVNTGNAPSLLELLRLPEPPPFGEPPLSELTFLLSTGGEVALGYPGSRTPSLQMTDGKQIATVTTLAQARERYRDGWECGVPARRGVRVHTPGTRLERLLSDEECFVRPRSA